MDLLRNRRYPAALTLLSAGVIGFGAMIKPEPRKTSPPVISESELVRLQRLAQKKTLRDLQSYFAGVAEEASQHVVSLETGGSGIVWDDSRIVTAGPAEAGIHRLAIARPHFSRPQSRSLRPAERAKPEDMAPGDSILIVWQPETASHLFAPGVFIGMAPRTCSDLKIREIQASIPLREEMLGAGVFDVEGALLGAVLRCESGYAAVAAADVDNALKFAETPAERLLDSYGIRVKSLDDSDRNYFPVQEGALVSEVWKTRPAGRAGLIPGDVIAAIDGAQILSAEQFTALAQPVEGRFLEVTVRRGSRTLQITVPADSGTEESSGFGLALEAEAGYPVAAVEPRSPAARGGIRAGDRVLLVNGRRPLSASAAARALLSGSGSAAHVVVARGARQFGVLLD